MPPTITVFVTPLALSASMIPPISPG